MRTLLDTGPDRPASKRGINRIEGGGVRKAKTSAQRGRLIRHKANNIPLDISPCRAGNCGELTLSSVADVAAR